jgi:hypothetical protein
MRTLVPLLVSIINTAMPCYFASFRLLCQYLIKKAYRTAGLSSVRTYHFAAALNTASRLWRILQRYRISDVSFTEYRTIPSTEVRGVVGLELEVESIPSSIVCLSSFSRSSIVAVRLFQHHLKPCDVYFVSSIVLSSYLVTGQVSL